MVGCHFSAKKQANQADNDFAGTDDRLERPSREMAGKRSIYDGNGVR